MALGNTCPWCQREPARETSRFCSRGCERSFIADCVAKRLIDPLPPRDPEGVRYDEDPGDEWDPRDVELYFHGEDE